MIYDVIISIGFLFFLSIGVFLGYIIFPTKKRIDEKLKEKEGDAQRVTDKYKDLIYLFTWCIYTSQGDIELAKTLARIRKEAKYYPDITDAFIDDSLNDFVLDIEKRWSIEEEEV